MIPKYIACVGSRETPADVLAWMERFGAEIVHRGGHILTGNAPGADQAWARGGNSVDPTKVHLRLPWVDFERQAIHPDNDVTVLEHLGIDAWRHCAALASAQHKRWLQLSQGAQKLVARNVLIIEPATLAIGYLNAGKVGGGGTGGAMRIAGLVGVPFVRVNTLEGVANATARLHKLLEPR